MSQTPFYKSKKFWTFIAAIVAAFSAFFAVGCSAQYASRIHGVHIDTVDLQICTHSKTHGYEKHW